MEAGGSAPPAEADAVDVAVLDMNHGAPNLGHASLVQAVQEAAEDLRPALEWARLRLRAVSHDVRRGAMVPEPPGARYSVYLGTGGPGHLDPRRNDGRREGSQGVVEDPAWEEPLFRLLDRVLGDGDSALLAVCHTFGVLCRWSRIADPVLRPAAKGGKSAGIVENLLAPAAAVHPWFSQLAASLPPDGRLKVLDHRLFDLVPRAPLPPAFSAIGYEALGAGGPPGEALTMVEWARDETGMPRVFGVNHHPEIADRAQQRRILMQKRARGEVTREWYEDRVRVLAQAEGDQATERALCLTSEYTLLAPLRHHLQRQIRRRAESLGRPTAPEDEGVLQPETVR